MKKFLAALVGKLQSKGARLHGARYVSFTSTSIYVDLNQFLDTAEGRALVLLAASNRRRDERR